MQQCFHTVSTRRGPRVNTLTNGITDTVRSHLKCRQDIQYKICCKTFVRLGQMKRHHVVHIDISLEETKRKQESFKNCFSARRWCWLPDEKTSLRHSLIHTNMRPYGCSVCGKTFRKRSAVKDHMVTHMVERSYKCKICSRTYGVRSSLLKLHEHTQRGALSSAQRVQRRVDGAAGVYTCSYTQKIIRSSVSTVLHCLMK